MSSIFRVDGQLQEFVINRVGQQYDLPEYVGRATVDDGFPSDVAELPLTVFGDQNTRSFPCHNKAACYLSMIDFVEQRAQMAKPYASRIETRLLKNAAAYGILPDVEAARNKHAQLSTRTLDTLPDGDFAVVRQFSDGSKERSYPLRNANEVKEAAAWLFKYAYELPFDDRHLIAKRIIDRAEDTAASLPEAHHERLELHAGYATVMRDKLATAIRGRARLIGNQSMRDDLYKMAAAVSAAEPDQLIGHDVAIGIVRNLDTIDRQLGLNVKYGHELMPPEESVYTGTSNVAAASLGSTVHRTTGDIYTHDDLGQLGLSQIRDTFGAEIAERCSDDGLFVDRGKLAEIAETLPRMDAEALTDLLQQSGITPITKAAAVSTRLTPADWVALAQV